MTKDQDFIITMARELIQIKQAEVATLLNSTYEFLPTATAYMLVKKQIEDCPRLKSFHRTSVSKGVVHLQRMAMSELLTEFQQLKGEV